MIEIDLHPTIEAVNGRQLEELIALYLRDRRGRTKAVTVGGYRLMLERFIAWWEEAGPGLDWEITPAALLAYSSWLQDVHRTRFDRALSTQGVADSLRRLRQLFAWAFRTNRIPLDISRWVAMPSNPGIPHRPIPLDALSAMMEVAGQAPVTVQAPIAVRNRNLAIIAFFAGTGCRLAEAAGAQVGDVTMEADGSGYVFLREAKFGKSRYAAFDAITGRHLRSYLDLAGWPAGPLLGLGRKGIYYVVRFAADRAGVRDVIRGPHDLRRLFVTYWTSRQPGQGYSLLLSKQVGHTSYSMTASYARLGIEDIRLHFVSPMQAV